MTTIIWWAALGIYLLGYVLSVRPLAARTLDNIVRAAERTRDYNIGSLRGDGLGHLVPTDSGRIRATWYALGKAIFWPVVIPVHLTARTVVSPTERLRASERENARLRKLAADEGLDWPEETK